MKEFLSVFSYTFYENARKKAFIISTIIVLILTIGICSIPAIIKLVEGSKKGDGVQAAKSIQTTGFGTVYVIDSKNILVNDLAEFSQIFNGYSFKLESPGKVDSLKKLVDKESSTTLMLVDEKSGVPCFNYIVKQQGAGLDPSALSSSMKRFFANKALKAANVSDDLASKVLSDVTYNVEVIGKGTINNYLNSLLVVMLLFFAVYFYGYGVAMSVASEKTSRVMELLVTSTRPSRIILGKSVAMGLLGLVQLSMIVASAVLTITFTFPKDFTIGGMSFDFSSFTPISISMIIAYFILGYSLYAGMNAVAGATVSKAEDVNSAIMPISMITMVAFYLAYGSVGFPDGQLAVAASIIPFSAPFSMPSRLLMTDVPVWQIAASIASMLAAIVLVTWISVKLYSSAVLHYGKRLKIGELFKMSRNQ